MMITFDYERREGGKKCRNFDDVISERPLIKRNHGSTLPSFWRVDCLYVLRNYSSTPPPLPSRAVKYLLIYAEA